MFWRPSGYGRRHPQHRLSSAVPHAVRPALAAPADCASMVLGPGPADHPCNAGTGTRICACLRRLRSKGLTRRDPIWPIPCLRTRRWILEGDLATDADNRSTRRRLPSLARSSRTRRTGCHPDSPMVTSSNGCLGLLPISPTIPRRPMLRTGDCLLGLASRSRGCSIAPNDRPSCRRPALLARQPGDVVPSIREHGHHLQLRQPRRVRCDVRRPRRIRRHRASTRTSRSTFLATCPPILHNLAGWLDPSRRHLSFSNSTDHSTGGGAQGTSRVRLSTGWI